MSYIQNAKQQVRNFSISASIILNQVKYMGVSDWCYEYTTLDDKDTDTFTNFVKVFFSSGEKTIVHKVNLVVLDKSYDTIIGRFIDEFK